MRNVYAHIAKELERASRTRHPEHYEIVPKVFTVEKVSDFGGKYLSFQKGEQRKFEGKLITERGPGVGGRVFFLPYSTLPNSDEKSARFIEIKGYGHDGRDICLWTHCDGDILNGMFYKNAKKEFDILEKAFSCGLHVPAPLFLGKISREEWLRSGLRVVNLLSGINVEWNIEELSKDNEKLKKEIAKYMERRFYDLRDFLSAFSQPYNAGVIGRAVISPFRLGDPGENYELNEENTQIARQCGYTFYQLINLGFLHLSPGTGNWTEAGELTDMADCYNLKKDRNISSIISLREKNWEQDFWKNLIGPFHTSNLSPFFIEGMLGKKTCLEEAAEEIKQRALQKITELKGLENRVN